MDALTPIINSLAQTPRQLEALFRQAPVDAWQWTPTSWDAIPGEMFTIAGQVCHLRDIETEGYQVRIGRMLEEHEPDLVSIDSYDLARDKDYAHADPEAALSAFHEARRRTLESLQSLDPSLLARRGTFAEYGQLNLQGLLHYLCSHDQQHLACMQWLLGKIAARELT
jgi:hypothetical protein